MTAQFEGEASVFRDGSGGGPRKESNGFVLFRKGRGKENKVYANF